MDDEWVRRYDQWMELRDLSPKTRECRISILSVFAGWVGKPFAEVTAEDADAWQRYLLRHRVNGSRLMTTSARHTYCKHLRAFYDFCVADGLTSVNPADVLILPKLGVAEPRPIADQDLELALAAAAGSPRLLAWLTLAKALGLRAVEIAGIERRDVLDSQRPALLHVHGKGKRERTLLLDDEVLWVLRPFLGERGRLFHKLDGQGPVTAAVVSQAVNTHLRELGIPATLHQCRHWFATTALRETKDLRLVQELMGHRSPTTTAIYAAPDETQLGPLMARLARRT